ncbi:DUF5615 family PIN-like protein [candidate division KSB1 bacterium]|nr:DUF5615 family PIN-like protein [candidate division KSB1 bacterium]
MRILIDESLPRYLTSIFKDHSAETGQEKGLSGISNGDLLAFAENKYDIFLSSDKNLKHQQNLHNYNLSIIILPSNKLSDIKSIETKLLIAVDKILPNTYIEF